MHYIYRSNSRGMAKHKLILEDVFEDVSYTLIAIHCSLEDYRLAYLLNKSLSINLSKKEEDLDFDHVSASYSIFEWEDVNHQTTWNLITNICRKESGTLRSMGSLFGNDEKTLKTYNLISEHKTVDYFLKISSDGLFSGERSILNHIQDVSQIVTAYVIDISQLKSRNNLIFN